MHYSRIRTARSLTVSLNMLYSGSQGGAWSGGGAAQSQEVVSQHALRQTPLLWTEFLTHASENITLPQTSFTGGNDRNWTEIGSAIAILCSRLSVGNNDQILNNNSLYVAEFY